MKLKSVLKELPLSTLEAIHRFWEFNAPKDLEGAADDAARHEALIEFLYPRLQMKHSFHAAYNRLDAGEKDLIFFLAIHGGDQETNEVAERCFGGQTEVLLALIERLTARGFVFRETVDFEGESTDMTGLPEPYLNFIELPSYWEGYLGSFLKDLPAPRLKSIANQGLKLKLNTSRKQILIWRIRRAMTDPAFLREFVGRLKGEHRDIVEALLERRGVSVYRDLVDQSFARRQDYARAENVEWLLNNSALVFTAVESKNKQDALMMIPRDMAYMILSDYQPDKRSLRELDTVSIPQAESQQLVLDNSNHLLRDLAILAAALRATPHRVLTSGAVGKNELKKILASMSSHKTVKYARFLTLFCIRRGFLVPAGENWTVTAEFDKWIADAVAAYRDIYSEWLDSTAWNEEFSEGDVAHASPPPANLIHAAELRRLVLRSLETIPHDNWIDFGAFADNLLPQIGPAIHGRGPADDYTTLRHMVLIIEAIIAESLHWLGVVTLGVPNAAAIEEIGSRGDDTLDPLTRGGVKTQPQPQARHTGPYAFAFKPTALGRRILASDAATDPARLFGARGAVRERLEMNERHFTVQPNLEILAPPDLNLPDFFYLCRFCEVVSVDVMSTLAVTKRSVRGAMDQGVEGEALIAFLKERSNIPLPETVRQLIEDCSSKHGEVTMGYAGGYIHVSDPALLEEIRGHRVMREFVKEVAGGCVIMLSPQTDVPKLARELRKAGFMPQVDKENVLTAENGDFLVRLNNQDLYDLMAILRFVSAMEDELGKKITKDKARPLLERLQPGPGGRFNHAEFVEAISKGFLRMYHAIHKKQLDEAAGRYKKQLARLLTSGSSLEERLPPFDGPNPAGRPEDVRRMIQYAIETDSRVEISYLLLKDGPAIHTIEPESLNDDRVYAFSNERDSHAMFRLSRIRKARLLV